MKAIAKRKRVAARRFSWNGSSNGDRAAVVADYFWNYNTVEMVLLFCAVLVVLAGVMFESGQLDSEYYQGQRDTITYITLTVIFFSLLPMIITPLVGSLILYWMIQSNGIIGASLQHLFNDPTLSLRQSPALTWASLLFYGVWTNAPFSFVVFYAGLQTVPADTLESAMIDGASRWERVRYVIIPHLMPLATFVALVQLMDNFRVFEPIIGFSAEAHAQSFSWIIFNDMHGETRLLSSASTTSVLTILGVAILLTPVLIRTWQDFKGKK